MLMTSVLIMKNIIAVGLTYDIASQTRNAPNDTSVVLEAFRESC